jgi:hypothetical protein
MYILHLHVGAQLQKQSAHGAMMAVRKKKSMYHIDESRSGRGPSSEYRRADLWFISNDPQLRQGAAPGQVADRTRMPWVCAVKSVWHGPNQDGK